MYFLCRVGGEFQEVQQVSISPGHEPSGASHSTLRPENMHENMFLQVPAHPPFRFRKTRFFLLRRFLLRSWYFVRYRRRWICGLSKTRLKLDKIDEIYKFRKTDNFEKKIEEIQKFGGKYDNFGMDDLKTRVEIEE